MIVARAPRRRRKGAKGNNPTIPRDRSLAPPQFQASIQISRVYRFQATTASSADQITATSLCDLLVMAVTSTVGYDIARAIKVRKVEMWGPMASNLDPVTVSIEWNPSGSGPVAGPSNIVSDTSMGATKCAHVVASPPANSASAFWQIAGGATPMMTLAFPANTIVDVHLSQILFDGETPVEASTVLTSPTIGQVYVRNLDSVSPGADVLAPVSYSTI